jgi:hypothetical protein
MTISGFTFVRNATKLFYPVKESIESILPIVDEFVVALGDCAPDDTTLEEIASIRSDKIKIIHTLWDLKTNGQMEYARQTDIAKDACKGDWLFYIQCDEVVHEKYLPEIVRKCEVLKDDIEVEGLLFRFQHFWGDFDHYLISHAWYPNEIRIIRNNKDIHSWRDAQSFRRIPNFNGVDYYQKKDTYKLKVVKVDACMYHYGWVRPPQYMQTKRKEFSLAYWGEDKTQKHFDKEPKKFNYGDLTKLPIFKGQHPAVLTKWISKFNWYDELYPFENNGTYIKHKHEKLRYRVLTFIEQKFLNGNLIGGFKNYTLIQP